MNGREIESYSVQAGDLLFARQSLVREGAGKCSIVMEAPEITTFESHLIRARLDRFLAVPLYYFYYFMSPQGKGNVQSIVQQVAAAGIRGSELSELLVPRPPLETQRRIAAILSAYDDLIENNTQRITALEAAAQALYREWFVEMRFPGHESAEWVDSELGRILRGWEVVTLGKACEIVMGQSPKSEYYNEVGSGLPFHQGVTNFGALFPVHQVYCTEENRIAETGDILISVRAPVGRINVADTKMVIGRGLAAIRNRQGEQAFTLYQLKHVFQEEDIIGGGTIFKSATKSDMHSLGFVQPSDRLAREFDENARSMLDLMANLLRRNTALREARDLLLPRLISGELSVENVPLPNAIET